MAELLGSYKNAYKKCWNVEVPDVLGWICGIFFSYPELYEPHKRIFGSSGNPSSPGEEKHPTPAAILG